MVIFEGNYLDTEPCICGRYNIDAHWSLDKALIILCCYRCGFITEVFSETVTSFRGLIAFWGRAVSDEMVRRIRQPQPAPAHQPFGVRHNLPPPKPTPPPPEPPIKEIPREYDRYELLELDKSGKNTLQKN